MTFQCLLVFHKLLNVHPPNVYLVDILIEIMSAKKFCKPIKFLAK